WIHARSIGAVGHAPEHGALPLAVLTEDIDVHEAVILVAADLHVEIAAAIDREVPVPGRGAGGAGTIRQAAPILRVGLVLGRREWLGFAVGIVAENTPSVRGDIDRAVRTHPMQIAVMQNAGELAHLASLLVEDSEGVFLSIADAASYQAMER